MIAIFLFSLSVLIFFSSFVGFALFCDVKIVLPILLACIVSQAFCATHSQGATFLSSVWSLHRVVAIFYQMRSSVLSQVSLIVKIFVSFLV